MGFKLNQTKQCKTCPWIIGNDPFDIPNYDSDLHEALKDTISREAVFNTENELKIMACHYSKEGCENYCIGWLHNQLGVGNNLGLRIKMMKCENAGNIEVVGEQHKEFNDTLPKTIL